MPTVNVCPNCDGRLEPNSRSCSCGWSADRKRDGNHIVWNHVCTWKYGDLKCRNPVGWFPHGATSGLCLFHRATSTGHAAAQIAEDSAIHDRESFVHAASRQTYGHADNPFVKALREQIAARPGAKKGGTFTGIEDWIPVCKARGVR